MNHKFKVGDKVRIIADGVLGVVTDIGYGAESDWDWRENPFYDVDFIDSDYCDSFRESELEEILEGKEINERIKELARQANVGSGITFRPENIQAFDDYSQRFAKLIIKECMSVNDRFVGHRIGEIDLDIVYKEHFGIE